VLKLKKNNSGAKRLTNISISISSAEVKERVELYPYSPSGTLWKVIGRIYLSLFLIIFFTLVRFLICNGWQHCSYRVL